MNQLGKLLICLLLAFLTGCGEFNYDVSQSRRYYRGGYVPGHVFRLTADAVVIATAETPHQTFLQRAEMPHPAIFHVVRRVPAGSLLRIDSLRHRFVIVGGFSLGDWVEVHGSILDRQNGSFIVEGDSDLSTERTGLFSPSIPMPNRKYLKDVTSDARR